MWGLLWAWASGCTLALPSPCDPSACSGGYGCDELGFCLDSCVGDEDCRDGFLCQDRECEVACVDANCGRYSCDQTSNTCFTRCQVDRNCNEGFVCPLGRERCQRVCEDADCSGGFACDELRNECNTDCFTSLDCREGFTCDSLSGNCL
ncbi:MAG: hypothetical protein AAF602_02230 [Myxococcota bacterium]